MDMDFDIDTIKRLQHEALLRDQFACAALTGLLVEANEYSYERMAQIAYLHADAMLHARSLTKETPP